MTSIPFWAWSWLLTAVGCLGLWAAGSKKAWGWAVGIGAQVLWVAYALSTDQLGFLVSAAVYGTVYGRNYVRWRRELVEAATPLPLGDGPPWTGRGEAPE